MGMDLFSIIVDIEECFDIELSEEDCAPIQTVGELHAVVVEKLDVAAMGPCLSMMTFHVLRRNLMSTCDLPREAVRVNTGLDVIIPAHVRRMTWERLENRMGLRLPALTLPTFVASAMFASTIGALVAIPVGVVTGASAGAVILALLLALSKHWAMHWLISPMANRFRAGIATVGDLARAILDSNFGAISKRARHACVLEIWHAVRASVSQSLGVSEEEIEPDSRFVEDLGAT